MTRRQMMLAMLATLVAGCGPTPHEIAKSRVLATAERLDGRTDDAGGYVRPGPGNEFTLDDEADPWGRPLRVSYTRGGFMEAMTVRAAGPDGLFHTPDDIVEVRSKVTFGGVGRGVRDNAEGLAEKSSRGFSRGLIRGAKDHFGKESGAREKGGE
jgi:hypothetical protein